MFKAKLKSLFFLTSAIGLLILLAAFLKKIDQDTSETKLTANVEPEETEDTKITEGSSRLLITGETFFGRQYELKRLNDETSALEFPFSGLESYNKSDYDAWLTHLECPITDRDVPFETQWNAIALNCRPEFMTEFAKWFDVVSIANNHIFDIDGEVGYEQTKDYLEEYDIQYTGHFLPSSHEDICEIVTVPINLTLSDDSTKKEDLPIALCGYNAVFNLPTQEDIDVISTVADKFFTIVMPQMGAEYVSVSDNIKREQYQAMVDAGADLIAASHPHAVQETAEYNGKLITYSLGNFIFDQQSGNIVQSSIAIDATLNFTTQEQIDQLNKWLTLDSCGQPKDDCSSQADGLDAESKPTIDYDILPGMQRNLVQSKLDGTDPDYQRILNITGWQKTKELLK